MNRYLITLNGVEDQIEAHGSKYTFDLTNFTSKVGLTVFDEDGDIIFQCSDYASIRTIKNK